MAKPNFLTISESDFSGGIDARSAESDIPEGFAEDIVNGEIIEKRSRKRAGYQGTAGFIPARVTDLTYLGGSTDNIEISLGEGVDLSNVPSSPIVVYGRVSSDPTGTNDFEQTDAAQYYPKWKTKTRKTFPANSTTTVNIPVAEHTINSNKQFVGVVQSSNDVNSSYTSEIADSLVINKTTFNIAVTETNGTSSDIKSFVYYSDKTSVLGSSYSTTYTTVSATDSIVVPASTHGLSNYGVIAKLYVDAGGVYTQAIPDSLTVDSAGLVTVTVTAPVSTVFVLVLSAAPTTNTVTQAAVGPAPTAQVQIINVTSPWIFFSVYSSSGGTLTEIIPDSYSYDSSTADVTITMNLAAATDIVVYYEYGSIRSNQIVLTANVGAVTGFTDTRPQLTVWGLDHSEIYGSSRDNREGWATHLDAYRRSAEQRLITGLGGNLFSAGTYSEIGTAYKLPVLYPSLQGRMSSTKVVAPLVADSGDAPGRSRGYLTHDGGSGHLSVITSAVWDSITGYTKYTLSMPNLSSWDSGNNATALATILSTAISTTSGYEDLLTVQDMSWAVHNGSFPIKVVTSGVNQITLWVDNLGVDSEDWDDTGCGGLGGVFTDEISLSAGHSTFLVGDVVTSDGTIGPSVIYTVAAVSTASPGSLLVSGIASAQTLPSGLKLAGTRNSSVMPLRDGAASPTASVTNLVQGDMVSMQTLDRLLRILYINSDVSRTVSITGNGTAAVVTMTAGDTTYLRIGGAILIDAGPDYSGAFTITDITSNTTFEFASEALTTEAGSLVGKTVQLDETLEWSDTLDSSDFLTVEARWIPIEAPDDSWALTPSTYVSHLDANGYGDQDFLRSVMVADNMYLTNGADEVLKFDGSSIYRAGLFSWQPGAFITTDTGATAKVVNDEPQTATATATTSGSGAGATTEMKVALGAHLQYAAGDRVYFEDGTGGSPAGAGTYTVKSIRADASNGYVVLLTGSTTITLGSAGSFIQKVKVYKYYYRLNAVDENDNVIASAVTGADDHVVELPADAAIYHRLVGLPAWDIYDYDKLEVEIYRTKSNTAAPFYKVTTLQMKFAASGDGYIDFPDSFADSDLIDLDPVNSALLGAELGTGWSEPLRASYLTTAANSLVLANLRDYPQLDVQLVGDSTLTVASFVGKKLTFRRDNTSTAAATDMINTAVYEWVDDSTEKTVTGITGTAGVSFSVACTSHGLIAGDWVYLYYDTVVSLNQPLTYAGWWQVYSVTDANNYVINYLGAGSGSATYFPIRSVTATNQEDIPVLLGEATGQDGNMGMLNGNSTFVSFQAMRKMSMAINASMRLVDTSLVTPVMTTFTPWLVARAGNEFVAGQLLVRQPRVDSTTVEVVLPASFGSLQFFVNQVRRSAAAEISAETRVYPSRLLVSYPNYPEIFDRPTVVIDTDSESAIDVNPADGQKLTGVIPFFGDSAFGAAQQGSVVVAFKENSIYLVDIAQKRAGGNAVQKLETQGLGCTAPYSIAHTKNGIMFANESGMYSLQKDLTIRYVGKTMERNWLGMVSRSLLSIAQGHHYGIGRQYKLSLPIIGSDTPTENSQAYVYDHSAEEEGKAGAWTRFTNHAATGWANLAQDAYFSTHTGRVFSIRRLGDDTDYRDDNQAIEWQLVTRGIHAGQAGIRKIFDGIITFWRSTATSEGTTVETATDLKRQFRETVAFRMPNPLSTDGFSDVSSKKVLEVRHSVPERRGSYLQIRLTNGEIDEGVEIAGLQIRVAGLSDRGVIEAADTTTGTR